MRPTDNQEAATRASETCSGAPGFSHYWEEDSWPVSTALRPILGLGTYETTRSAWDVYLFYGRGARWVGQAPPAPTEWAHQLNPDPGVGERLTPATVARWLRYQQ
jgi:hypothetical protein